MCFTLMQEEVVAKVAFIASLITGHEEEEEALAEKKAEVLH